MLLNAKEAKAKSLEHKKARQEKAFNSLVLTLDNSIAESITYGKNDARNYIADLTPQQLKQITKKYEKLGYTVTYAHSYLRIKW